MIDKDKTLIPVLPIDSDGVEANLEHFPINGKWITIKGHLTLDDTFDLPGKVAEINKKDLRTQIPIMTTLIDSWEFDYGDPSDEASYGKMHPVKEFLPLSDLLQKYLTDTVGIQLKNSGSQSFSL